MWQQYGNRITIGLASCGILLFLMAAAEFIWLGPDFSNGPPSYMRLTQ